MDDLHKVPDDALIKDLKKQLSHATQKLSANEQYIYELEDQICTLLKSNREDKLIIKTDRRVKLLTQANIKFRKQIKELEITNNRYLTRILNYEKNHKTDNTQ